MVLMPAIEALQNKYTAYYGEDYTDSIVGFRLYTDYYRFLFKNNIVALHLFPQLQTYRSELPVWNCGVGLFFNLKNAKDDKDNTVVNAELFYNVLDVFDVTNSDYRLIERNNVGIRFSFPINFKID